MLREGGLAGLALAAAVLAAPAQEMKSPPISPTHVDWNAVAVDLAATTLGAAASDPESSPPPAISPAAAAELIASLNRATGERFVDIAASPVPVLLPFDTAAFLRDRAGKAAADGGANARPGNYLLGFNAVPFFYPGPAGYDAVVIARAQEMRELGIGFSEPIHIHISGSALVYALDEPTGMIGWPVHGLDEIPDVRRMYLESNVRYTFVRYGVPYVVAIECFEGGSRFRKPSCRDADKVAVRFLKSLRIAGGAPRPEPDAIIADTIDRPAATSTVFTYHRPGNLLPGTGFKRKSGVADYTVYSKIRFPIADAPAFANSQSFMNWGNCEATGRNGAGMRGRVAAYRCRVNNQRTLISDESAADNFSYPWRDNFCEHRFFFVGQCPGGLGHQGQDIRPATCKQRIQGANRCEPYQHDVVAVRDGAVLRAPRQETLYIVVNAPNERIRFRYLHMQPKQFDADGMVSGRLVREGEVIGKVGNYFKHERGTTYHLHFDVQVPTKYGWVFVNPYMTLVAAYERLIRGRGQEISDEVPTVSLPLPPRPDGAGMPEAPELVAKPTEIPVESPSEAADSGMARNDQADQPSPVAASVPADAGISPRNGMEHRGASARHQSVVRPMGR
jgi:peptidase M23-like protein